ncbi:MAG TPA: FkbM family methyltransferase [Gemmataceae bacterium]|jgi:FkbM family methyltransferase|nr:FkbM family methyltransferase [Gemmataceae bacterium]
MPFVSFAQHAEDVILQRAFRGQQTGFYIDVGANDPTYASVTRSFYERGWHGINVEPARTPFTRLRAARPRDINLSIGLSDRPGSLCFHECVSESTWSTFSPHEAAWFQQYRQARYAERHVPVWTLARLCERYVDGEIDFLSIDVENHERQVIAGHDWQRWRPRIVMVEDSSSYESSEAGKPTHLHWEPLLVQAGYLLGLCDGINRFYVRQEEKEMLPLLRVPEKGIDYVPFDSLGGLRKKLAVLQEKGTVLRPVVHVLCARLRRFSNRHPQLAAATKRAVVTLCSRLHARAPGR